MYICRRIYSLLVQHYLYIWCACHIIGLNDEALFLRGARGVSIWSDKSVLIRLTRAHEGILLSRSLSLSPVSLSPSLSLSFVHSNNSSCM